MTHAASSRETSPMDLEQLWIRLAEAGITAMLKIDHERLAEHGRSWTVLLSGPPLGDALVRAEESSLDRCLQVSLTRLRAEAHGEWSWLTEFER